VQTFCRKTWNCRDFFKRGKKRQTVRNIMRDRRRKREREREKEKERWSDRERESEKRERGRKIQREGER